MFEEMLHTEGEQCLIQNLNGILLKVIQLYWHIILLSCIQCCTIPHTIDRSPDCRFVLAVYWIKLTPFSWKVCQTLCDEANCKCQLLDMIHATLDISLAKVQLCHSMMPWVADQETVIYSGMVFKPIVFLQ